MPIRHNTRTFTPDNANGDRADWNHHQVLDPEDDLPSAEQMLEGVPEDAEAFTRTNNDVDPDDPVRSFYHLHKKEDEMKNLGRGDPDGNRADRLRARIWDQVDEIKERGKRVQTNSVKYVDHLFTASPHYFREDPKAGGGFDREKVQEWLDGTLDAIRHEFDTSNIAAINLHLDESTPHIHLQTVPETPDGRLSINAKYSPEQMRNRQTVYAEFLPDEIQRGEMNSSRERRPTTEVYKDTVEELEEKTEQVEDLKERLDVTAEEVKRLKKEEVLDDVRDLPLEMVVSELNLAPYTVKDITNEDGQVKVDGEPFDGNAIDLTKEALDLTVYESAKFLKDKERFRPGKLAQQLQDSREELQEIESTGKKLIQKYEKLEDKTDQLESENETLKETLEDVAEEHNLEIDLGETFYTDHSGLDEEFDMGM